MARYRYPLLLVVLLGWLVIAPVPGAAAATSAVDVEVLTSDGNPAQYAEVYTQSGPSAGSWFSYDPSPMNLEPGEYTFSIRSYGDESFEAISTVRSVDGDVTLTFRPSTRAMPVTLKDHLGRNVTATGRQSCTGTADASDGYTTSQLDMAGLTISAGSGTLPVLTDDGATCTTRMTTASGTEFQRDYTPPVSTYAIALRPPVDVDVVLDDAAVDLYTSRVFLTFTGTHPFATGSTGGGEIPEDNPDWQAAEGEHVFRIEANDGPFTISSETARQQDFRTVTARRAGTGITQSTVFDLAPSYRPMHVVVQDPDGAPSSGTVQVQCQDAATATGSFTKVWYQLNGVQGEVDADGLHRDDGLDACKLRAVNDDFPRGRATANPDSLQDPEPVVLRYPTGHTLAGTVGDGAGGAVTQDYVEALAVDGFDDRDDEGTGNIDENGRYEMLLGDRPVILEVHGRSDRIDDFRVVTPTIDPSTTTRDITADVSPVRVRFRDVDGAPSTGSATLECAGTATDPTIVRQSVYTERNDVTGSTTLWGMDGTAQASSPDEPCVLRVHNGVWSSHDLTVPPGGTDVIVYPAGRVLLEDPAAPAGDDGVSDITEQLAPNGGDGNGDGTPDDQQDNVTSLPASGAGTAGDPDYVTLESPAGTTLTQVTTQPTGAAGSPPPSGVTLISGLVGFKLTGLASGASAVVKIYSTASATPTGYAKYHDGAWTVLPADRVSVTGTTVALTLADGGVGDDDGTANGTIVDPGGPAVVQTDHDPPVITTTGVSDGATYTIGNVPTAGCTATDASALDGACTVAVTGGRSNGVGDYTGTATAKDVHGNTATQTVHWSVHYRVNGFAAPLNNPPGATSVFKSGSTVTVGLVLRKANGTLIAPTTAPTWVTPVRLSTTKATVNESTYKDKPTTGTKLVYKNGTWNYVWATKPLTKGYLYRLAVTLDDGTTHTIDVGVK